MTYHDKHGAIASGIASGKSNREIADELGVSHGMVQKHRSGETRSGFRDYPDPYRKVDSSFDSDYVTDAESIRRFGEWRKSEAAYQKFLLALREQEALCCNCRVETIYGVCPSCGRNKFADGHKLPMSIRCFYCEELTDTGFCGTHGFILENYDPWKKRDRISHVRLT